MTGDEARIREIERRLMAIPIVNLEGRVARLEQLGWQDSGRLGGASMGVRVWIIKLEGCYGLGLPGETVTILDLYGGSATLGTGVTDSGGYATIVTYGGDSLGTVVVESSPARFIPASQSVYGADGAVTFYTIALTEDASHWPGPINDPRPWGASMTLVDSTLSATATLTYGAGSLPTAWYGPATGSYAGAGGCGAVASLPLIYEVDPAGSEYFGPGALIHWRGNISHCPATFATFLETDRMTAFTNTPGAFTASASGLVNTATKLYTGSTPTLAITGT